jgi:tRNA(Ile)-lysidine synthase
VTLHAQFAVALVSKHKKRVGVAVSGGSDSMALLHLAVQWARSLGIQVFAATVDHGLRPEAADEAAHVAKVAAGLGVAHETLKWDGWTGVGNLQAAARTARYHLLSNWSARHDLDYILLGHTMDDQAETILMSLARGSGVDGLSGMAESTKLSFFRPLLGMRRQALCEFLAEGGIDWIDDPSNDDDQFDRVKARQMMPHLAKLGLTMDRLVATAAHMERARISLSQAATDYAKTYVISEGPDLLMPLHALQLDSSDTEGRVLSAAIGWISGAPYRPRYKALCDAASAVLAGQTRTLHGVKLVPEGDYVRLFREFSACEGPVFDIGSDQEVVWDTRWRVSYENPVLPFDETSFDWPTKLTIRALGDAVSEVKTWRQSGLLRASLIATPAIFDGDRLISAPIAGFSNGFSAQYVADFHRSLHTH